MSADPARPAIEVRLAHAAELARVGEVTFAAYDADYGPLSPDYIQQLRNPQDRLDDFEIWIAVDADGEILGTTSILRDGRGPAELRREDELYFRLLAVAPQARRRGVGSALVELADRLARERGKPEVVLNSGPQMFSAHALYLSLGFTLVAGRTRIVTQDGREFEILTFSRPVGTPPRHVPVDATLSGSIPD